MENKFSYSSALLKKTSIIISNIYTKKKKKKKFKHAWLGRKFSYTFFKKNFEGNNRNTLKRPPSMKFEDYCNFILFKNNKKLIKP